MVAIVLLESWRWAWTLHRVNVCYDSILTTVPGIGSVAPGICVDMKRQTEEWR